MNNTRRTVKIAAASLASIVGLAGASTAAAQFRPELCRMPQSGLPVVPGGLNPPLAKDLRDFEYCKQREAKFYADKDAQDAYINQRIAAAGEARNYLADIEISANIHVLAEDYGGALELGSPNDIPLTLLEPTGFQKDRRRIRDAQMAFDITVAKGISSTNAHFIGNTIDAGQLQELVYAEQAILRAKVTSAIFPHRIAKSVPDQAALAAQARQAAGFALSTDLFGGESASRAIRQYQESLNNEFGNNLALVMLPLMMDATRQIFEQNNIKLQVRANTLDVSYDPAKRMITLPAEVANASGGNHDAVMLLCSWALMDYAKEFKRNPNAHPGRHTVESDPNGYDTFQRYTYFIYEKTWDAFYPDYIRPRLNAARAFETAVQQRRAQPQPAARPDPTTQRQDSFQFRINPPR